ncbi:hypothetical protein HQ584_01735 [Patescibacteria group bacterium]|nr:hypothetical protein [Patescibacteria group bacterium]
MEKKYYDIQDVINAGYNLTPLKCRHCGHIGEVIFLQYIGDGQCSMCGEWQLEKEV